MQEEQKSQPVEELGTVATPDGAGVVTPEPNKVETPDKQPHQHKKKWLWIILLIVVLVFGAAIAWYFLLQEDSTNNTDQVNEEPAQTISNYEECVAAGYPIMESYPEQCSVPNGDTFTRDISNDEVDDEDSQENQDTEKADTLQEDEVHYLIEGIKLVYSEDVSKLPTGTPQEFITFITDDLLSKNLPSNQCVEALYLTKLSLLNMGGGLTSEDPNNPETSQICIGGGKAVYSTTDNKTWDGPFGGHAVQDCELLVNNKIFYEFDNACLDVDGASVLDNPNGYLGSKADYDEYLKDLQFFQERN